MADFIFHKTTLSSIKIIWTFIGRHSNFFFLTLVSLYLYISFFDYFSDQYISHFLNFDYLLILILVTGISVSINKSNQNLKFFTSSRILILIIFFGVATFLLLDSIFVFNGKLIGEVVPLEEAKKNLTNTESGQTYAVGVNGSKKSLIIEKNPYYFDFVVPRAFHEVNVEARFQFQSLKSNVFLGTKNANGAYARTLLYAYDPLLESLPEYWSSVKEDNFVLFQKDLRAEAEFQIKNNEYDTKKHELDTKFSEGKRDLELQLDGAKISKTEFDKRLEELIKAYRLNLKSLENILTLDIQPPKYESVSTFLSDQQKDFNKVSVLNTSLDQYFFIQDKKQGEPYSSEVALRGNHVFGIYKSSTIPLRFSVIYKDSNKHYGADQPTLLLKQGDRVFARITGEEDGIIEGTSQVSDEKKIEINSLDVAQGFYTLAFESGNDLIITSINTNASSVATFKSVYIAENRIYSNILNREPTNPITIFTNSNSLNISTDHPEGFQNIKINGELYAVNETVKRYQITDLSGVSTIEIPRGDLQIDGDGFFSLEEDNGLLLYKKNEIDSLSVESIQKSDYIFAYYPQGVIDEDGLQVSSVSIEVPHISFENNMAAFYIDFGELKKDKRTVLLKSFVINLTKAPITVGKVFEKIKNEISSN